MATKNTNSTRFYSYSQENSVAEALGGKVQPNSGATNFKKLDVIVESVSLGIECKTCVEEKKSFTIKKEWLEKNKLEAFEMRLDNHCVAFNFGPKQKNYYIIDENLMKFLVEKLEEENE